MITKKKKSKPKCKGHYWTIKADPERLKDFIKRTQVSVKAWRARNPEKVRAQRIVFVAVRNGSLIRQQCFCGKKRTEAHHEDYTQCLNVVWLCKRHHAEADKLRRNGVKRYPHLSTCK